jgi:uncharacterized membrane protein YhfC
VTPTGEILTRAGPWLAAAGLVTLIGPLLAALWWHRRSGAGWRAFAFGAVIFIVAQVVLRLPWQIPLGVWVKAHPQWLTAFLVVSALSAGVFEEGARYVGYRTLLRGDRRVATGVMYGLGHGGVESMLVVGVQLVALLGGLILADVGRITDPRAIAALQLAAAHYDAGTAVATVIERIAAITLHVALALIVLQALVRRQWRWLGAAIALHAAVDLVAVVLAQSLKAPVAAVEAFLVAASAASLYVALRLATARPHAGPAQGAM